ncbi:hypothetical protein C7391_0542 [Methanimicrococcus blatticola]|uniref:Uncharacterized protein n=2 Tax=Methanimicrococcus blatticola TaxID=91560 RepID=A0A484F6N6_9EURY|nr:hypothetical protein C7391_0542 [Methanimicrococcus blatticola]
MITLFFLFLVFTIVFLYLFAPLLQITADISTFSIACFAYLVALMMLFYSEKHNLTSLYKQNVELNLKKLEILVNQIQKIYEPLDMIIYGKIEEKEKRELFKNVYLNRYIVNADEQKRIEKINEIIVQDDSFENAIEHLNYFKGKTKEIQEKHNKLMDETYECLDSF